MTEVVTQRKRSPAGLPWSARMRAVMERLLQAEGHTIHVGPGHDFQTCTSLHRRGDIQRVVYGEAPRECCTATITAQGHRRAMKTFRGTPEIRNTTWPFAFSSRGWHQR